MPVFAALTYTADVDWTAPEQAEEMKGYAAFSAAAQDVIRGGAALYPTSTATQVRVDDAGEVIATDGPYAETKEALTGFFLLECADLDEAIRRVAQLPSSHHGVTELRPVIEFPG